MMPSSAQFPGLVVRRSCGIITPGGGAICAASGILLRERSLGHWPEQLSGCCWRRDPGRSSGNRPLTASRQCAMRSVRHTRHAGHSCRPSSMLYVQPNDRASGALSGFTLDKKRAPHRGALSFPLRGRKHVIGSGRPSGLSGHPSRCYPTNRSGHPAERQTPECRA